MVWVTVTLTVGGMVWGMVPALAKEATARQGTRTDLDPNISPKTGESPEGKSSEQAAAAAEGWIALERITAWWEWAPWETKYKTFSSL